MQLSYEMVIKVRLGRTHIGNIVKTAEGYYQYFPKGSKKGGHKYTTLEGCKHSLETY